MKKKTFLIAAILLMIPAILFAQWRVNGKYISPNSINNTKIVAGTMGGEEMYDATLGEMWIPVDWDSGGATATGLWSSGAWNFGADNFPTMDWSGTEPAFKTLGFDAGAGSVDDSAWVSFMCPANYKDDTMELYLYGFHLDDTSPITDSLVIQGTVNAITAGDLTNMWADGTAMTAYADVLTNVSYTSGTTDSCLHIFNMDPEVENIDAGDWVNILFYVDESRSDLASDFFIFAVRVTWDIKDTP